MTGNILKDRNNKVLQPLSNYQPTQEVAEFTALVQKDYAKGMEILQKSWTELNNRTVIQDDQHGKMMFNAFVDTEAEDSNEDWKYRGTRSRARNKAISTYANLTENFLLPLYLAQNDDDEEDRGISEVMRDGIEWMTQPTVSNYQFAFLQTILTMLYSPVVFLQPDYCEAYTYNRKEDKEVIDDFLSGFQCGIKSCNQVLIGNAFERNIQKQPFIIERSFYDYETLEAKYKNHPNWQFVQKGIRSIYNGDDGLFYDFKDDEHESLVAEEIWKSRSQDLEIPFVNGIYMGIGSPYSKENAIRHRDNRNKPKYNLVRFVFSNINEYFFYGKSLMNILQWENMKYDAMDEVIMNRALLEVEVPVAITGSDRVDSSIIFPNSVTAFEDKDTRITPLLPNSNLSAGFKILQDTEEGMDETSGISPTLEGQLPDASQKAYSVAQAQVGAKKTLKAAARALTESVIYLGDLMKDIFINYYTTAIPEIVGESVKLRYRKLFLNTKDKTGKDKSKSIVFDESLISKNMSDEEKTKEQLRRLEKTDYKKGKEEDIVWVNPEVFARFKFLCKVDIEEMFVKNSEYWQATLMALRQQLMNDPYIDIEEIDRELLYSFFKSKGDKFIKEQAEVLGLPQGVLEEKQSPMVNQMQNSMTAKAINNQIQ